ncbi:MAG: alpha/beta hydrolase, partial [Nocardioides sp.]
MMPIVARPGQLGALTLDGAMEDYLAIAGPTWRNEIDAAVGMELGSHRPTKVAKDVVAPILVQIADVDRSAPPQAAAKAAFAARALVRHYPCDHFDVYDGKAWHAQVVRHQVDFLKRIFADA